MRILLISGEPKATAKVTRGLRSFGYAVDTAETQEEAEQLGRSGDYDAIVAEAQRRSPFDAVQITRMLRNSDIGDPLLIVADDVDEQEVIKAFDAGADQVMDHAHSFNELLSRIRSLLRQCQATASDILRFRDVEMDLTRLTVTRDGRAVDLIGKPLALLEYFIRRSEKVCSREEIGRSVWDRTFDPYSNVIDVTVSKIRQQLDRPFAMPYLHTVVGKGYVLSETAPGKTVDQIEARPAAE